MAMLKETIVNGSLRVTGNFYPQVIPLKYGGTNSNLSISGLLKINSDVTAITTIPVTNSVYNIKTSLSTTADFCTGSAGKIIDSEYNGTRYIKVTSTVNYGTYPTTIAGIRNSDATSTSATVKDVSASTLIVSGTDTIADRHLSVGGVNDSSSSTLTVLV